MRVLFAVNNEKISEEIKKQYQAMYKELISGKNVYYFNAIIQELQRDKSYDRIVIGEDLEPYANNNYDVIDNFLYDKLDSISDEASNSREGDIPIILIATDRRERKDALLGKLFSIGIYNALVGKDRRIQNVCKLINMPRTKKEAKIYYGLEGEVTYVDSDPDSVKEEEIQNILNHYKKLGKNENLYVESFEKIAEEYTPTQLKLITKFLPLNVRAVLEEKCPKYQEVMIGSVKNKVPTKGKKTITAKDIESKNVNKIELIDKELEKARLNKPVVIPSAIDMQKVKKVYTNTPRMEVTQPVVEKEEAPVISNFQENSQVLEPAFDFDDIDEPKQTSNTAEPAQPTISEAEDIKVEKRGRGRPKKEKTSEEIEEEQKPKRGRGRPKKVEEPTEQNQEEPVNLFQLEENENTEAKDNSILNNEEQKDDEFFMPGVEEDNSQIENNQNNNAPVDFFSRDFNNQIFENNNLSMNQLPGVEKFNKNKNSDATEDSSKTNDDNLIDVFNINDYKEKEPEQKIQDTPIDDMNNYDNPFDYFNKDNQVKGINSVKTVTTPTQNEQNLVTGEGKVVSFVGTSKNGTSFLVNNLAVKLSEKGIKTAILDLTKNKNAYYIYTLNEDSMREKAFKCIDGLRSGVTDGIPVSKNLTVYTTLPGENSGIDDYENILNTLKSNYTVILLDCDFDTNYNYFANAQEIYLVQTYDILTIQPLTAFLNELKYKNILNQNKLRIVINKTLKLRKLTDKMIIGGLSCYNDPASTYLNTLFDRENVKYTTIPFEDQTYARYLERLVDCEISLNGYSKTFLEALEKLCNMVYPLIANGKDKYQANKKYNNYEKKNANSTFNSNMNATLNRMRNNF